MIDTMRGHWHGWQESKTFIVSLHFEFAFPLPGRTAKFLRWQAAFSSNGDT